MGLFSSKTKEINGLSFIDMSPNKWAEYVAARQSLLFSSGGDLDNYLEPMWNYKQGVRRRYSENRLRHLDYPPLNGTMSPRNYTELCSFLVSVGSSCYAYENFDDSPFITFKMPEFKSYISFLEFGLADSPIDLLMDSVFFDVFGDLPSDTTLDYYHGELTTIEFSNGDLIAIMHGEAGYYLEPPPDGWGDDVEEEDKKVVLIESDSSVTSDAIPKDIWEVVPRLVGYDTSKNVLTSPELPQSMIDRGFVYDYNSGDSLLFAPLVSVRPPDKLTIVEQNALTPAQQEIRNNELWKIKRLGKIYSQSVDSLDGYYKNDKIKDFRLSLMADPNDAELSQHVAKELFRMFEEVTRSSPCDESNLIFKEKLSGKEYTVDLSIYGVKIDLSMNLIKKTFSGNYVCQSSVVKHWKIKTRQKCTNEEKFYAEILDIYESELGLNPDYKTARDMAEEINLLAHNNPTNDLYVDSAKKLPPISRINDKRPRRTIVVQCTEDDIPKNTAYNRSYSISRNFVYKDQGGYLINFWNPTGSGQFKPYDKLDSSKFGDNMYIIDDIVKIQELYAGTRSSESKHYHAKTIQIETTYVTTDKLLVDYNDVAAVDENGYLEVCRYDEDEDKTYVYNLKKAEYTYKPNGYGEAKIKFQSDDNKIRLPLLHDVLTRKSYYEYIELEDYCITGISFTSEKIKVKWYQRGIFQVVMMIVAVIISVAITYFSLGTGATLGAAILSTAVSMLITQVIIALLPTLADALGVDVSHLQALLTIATALYSGNLSNLDLGFLAADTYLKIEAQNTIDEMKDLFEEEKAFTEKISAMMHNLEFSAEPKTYTKEDIINNIVSTQSDSSVNIGGPHLTSEFVSELENERLDWNVDDFKEIVSHSTDALFRNNIIPRFSIEPQDISYDPIIFGDRHGY